jgi:hypothetical protein
MPQLFGTDYLLPIIVIVVLLIALLVLLAIRRRSAAGAKGEENVSTAVEVERAAAGETGLSATASPPVAEAGPADHEPAAAVTAAPGAASARAAASAPTPTLPPPVPEPKPRPAAARAAADPLSAVLSDLLDGWGDLTAEDTRRLEVFRAEKVIAAISALELPKSKASENARTRLTQLRQYAGDLERRMKPAAAVTAGFEDGASLAEGARGATPAPADLATEIAGDQTALGAIPEEPSAGPAAEPASVVPRSAGPERFWFLPAEPETTGGEETSPAMGPVSAMPAALSEPAPSVASAPLAAEVPGERKALGDIESFWAETESVWQAPPPEVQEELVSLGIGEEPAPLQLPTEPAAGEAQTESATAEVPTEPAPGESLEEPTLETYRQPVKTAADVLGLPVEEQVEMVAFLEPWELAAVFQATSSPKVKRAVIDTLTHIASPTSLSALGTCLDDPDRDIQLYALEAAERLLGTVGQ